MFLYEGFGCNINADKSCSMYWEQTNGKRHKEEPKVIL